MGKKLDNVRIVSFKEDYNPTGKLVLYAKNSTHAIHKDVVELIQDKVKVEVKEFDEKKEYAKAKEAFDKAKKEGNA